MARFGLLMCTVNRLPLTRQREEFDRVIFKAVDGRNYEVHPEWSDSLFPRFIERWGYLPVAELPLTSCRHDTIASWIRNEIDKLRTTAAAKEVVSFQIEPWGDTPGETLTVDVHLCDTVVSILKTIMLRLGTEEVGLWFDDKFLRPEKTLLSYHVNARSLLQYSNRGFTMAQLAALT